VRVETTDGPPPLFAQAVINILPSSIALDAKAFAHRPVRPAKASTGRKPTLRIDEPEDNSSVPAGTVRVQGIIRPKHHAVYGILIEPATAKRIVALGKTVQHGPSWVIEFAKVTAGDYTVRVRSVDGEQFDEVKISVP
jgi:hypothetical protein